MRNRVKRTMLTLLMAGISHYFKFFTWVQVSASTFDTIICYRLSRPHSHLKVTRNLYFFFFLRLTWNLQRCQLASNSSLQPLEFKDKWNVWRFDTEIRDIHTSVNNVSGFFHKWRLRVWDCFCNSSHSYFPPGAPVPQGRTNLTLWVQGMKVINASLFWAVKSGTTKPLYYYLGYWRLQSRMPPRAFNKAGS